MGQTVPLSAADRPDAQAMSRKRFIHPCILSDPAFVSMTPLQRLLFVGCLTLADDEGRLPGTPRHLLGLIFGGDSSISERKARVLRDGAAAKCANFVVYQVAGTEYIAFRRWYRYQKPSHPTPSRLPAPQDPCFYVPAPPPPPPTGEAR